MGVGVGVGVVSHRILKADEEPVISKEPEGLLLVPTLQRRDKGGQFLGALAYDDNRSNDDSKERGQSAYIAHDAGRACTGTKSIPARFPICFLGDFFPQHQQRTYSTIASPHRGLILRDSTSRLIRGLSHFGIGTIQ